MGLPKSILLLFFLAFSSSCATPKNQVKDIETKNLTTKGSINGAKIGINDQKQILIQDEDDADNELRSQEAVNSKLQFEFDHQANMLKRCRLDLNDPRLGGSGKMPELPAIDEMKDPDEVREELGLNEDGQLKVVKRTDFVQRLLSARKYERALRKMTKITEKHREDCEYQMRQVRVKAGLPGGRYEAQGYFLNDELGTWVETRRGEGSLDDAFEIKGQIKQSRSASE